MVRKCLVGIAGVVTMGFALSQFAAVTAQTGAALTGVVSSQQEGKMEGVVVTARGEGANFSVSVVSDAEGRYAFPRSHLPVGKYSLKIRAFGYDLAGGDAAEVRANGTTTLDLALAAAKDPSAQLTSTDWLNLIPGTVEQKAMVQREALSCTYCHSLERVLKSRHNADQFVRVLHRMQEYFGDGSMASTEGRGRARFKGKEEREQALKNPDWGYDPPVKKTVLAEYLASVNQSGGRALPAATKALPRPKGKETRVIITTWDMPRKDTVAHDSNVDAQGNVWYTDQSDYYVGRLDPRTNTFKEWPLEKSVKHEVGGACDVQVDRKGRVWFSVTTDKFTGPGTGWGLPGYFDPRTEKYQSFSYGEKRYMQFNAMAADGSIVHGNLKIDPDTGKLLDRFEWRTAPNLPPGDHWDYESAMDSKGNWYGIDFIGDYIVKVDAKTKKVKFLATPTRDSMPRRGQMDNQDRFWFAEYFTDRLAMLDGKTEKFKEWKVKEWTGPYTVSVPNKNGHVFAPSAASDRLYRLDPATGEILAYLMPTMNFDSKQVAIDPVGGKAAMFANTRNAQIVRVEPLD